MNLCSVPPARVLCLWFPDWPIQQCLQGAGFQATELTGQINSQFPSPPTRATSQPKGVLLVQQSPQGQRVAYCNDWAKKQGVVSGMQLSEACSLIGANDSLLVQDVQPEHDQAALVQVAQRLDAYSPRIGLEECESPECLLLDITAVEHCFGGELGLVQKLMRQLTDFGLVGCIAIGDNPAIAWAAAHFRAKPEQPAIIPVDGWQLLRDLPVEGLRLPQAVTQKLESLGIITIGQLIKLDRVSAQTRLGDELLMRLDQFTGARQEWVTPCCPEPTFIVHQEYEDGITHPEFFQERWMEALQKLVCQMNAKGVGAARIECRCRLENGMQRRFEVRFCSPTADADPIADLLRLKLENFKISAPLIRLTIQGFDTAPIHSSTVSLLANSREESNRLAELFNRLSTRLGTAHVCQARLLPNPIPEQAVQWIPITDSMTTLAPSKHTEQTQATGLQALDRPTGLFGKPKPIQVAFSTADERQKSDVPAVLWCKNKRFHVAHYQGPERIESGWWQSNFIRRDYYQIDTTQGQRLWIFQSLDDQQWFWHGEVF